MGSGWVHNAPPEVNAISRYPTILAVCISLTAVMTAIIAVRGYVRAVMLKSIGADDWTILFSGVSLDSNSSDARFMADVFISTVCTVYCTYLSFVSREEPLPLLGGGGGGGGGEGKGSH